MRIVAKVLDWLRGRTRKRPTRPPRCPCCGGLGMWWQVTACQCGQNHRLFIVCHACGGTGVVARAVVRDRDWPTALFRAADYGRGFPNN